MAEEIRSYTSVGGRRFGSVQEFVRLFRRSRQASRDIGGEVRHALRMLKECESQVQRHAGVALQGLQMLEIGPGQMPRQSAYFAARNQVIGVDLDVIPRGFNFSQYYRLLLRNGPKRLIKTIARKAMGFDRRFREELRKQMGLARLAEPTMMEMDATRLQFPDASFDFVYSFSVFEHLPDPAAVLREISRVLRPGGVSYQHLHLYTADDGCHDLRLRGDDRDEGMPFWPHLRPQHQAMVQAFAYINKLTLKQWREIFLTELPGVKFEQDMNCKGLPQALAELRAAGEMTSFADEELLTRNFIAIWRKPA